VSSVESGRRTPSTDALHYFAAKLGVDADELLTGRPTRLPVELELALAELTLSTGQELTQNEVAHGEQVCQDVDRTAEAYGLVEVRARARSRLAVFALWRGEVRRADELFESVERLLRDAPLPWRVPALVGRAECLRRLGDSRYGLYLLESTLKELNRTGLIDPTALLALHAGLVGLYLDVGATKEAAAAADEAVKLAPVGPELVRLATMYLSVARTLTAEGQVAEARRYLDRLEELWRLVALRPQIGECHWARGQLLSREGRDVEACAELETAYQMLRGAGDPARLAGAAADLADVRRRLGHLAEAEQVLTEAAALVEHTEDPLAHARISRQRGLLALEKGESHDGETHLRMAVEQYAAAGRHQELALAQRLLGDMYRNAGRMQEAALAYRHGLVTVEQQS